MRAAVALMLACGCHLAFELEPPAPSDSAVPAGPPCEPGAGFYDSFDGDDPCPWGDVIDTTARVSLEGGRLRVSPLADQVDATFGGCKSRDAFPVGPAGIIISMTPALDLHSTYLVLHAYPGDDTRPNVTLHQQQGEISVYSELSGKSTEPIPYDADKMRWLRLRPDHEAGSMIAESSLDGSAWTHIGVAEDAVMSEAYLNFGAGTWTRDADPGSVAFEHVQVCPP